MILISYEGVIKAVLWMKRWGWRTDQEYSVIGWQLNCQFNEEEMKSTKLLESNTYSVDIKSYNQQVLKSKWCLFEWLCIEHDACITIEINRRTAWTERIQDQLHISGENRTRASETEDNRRRRNQRRT